MDKHICENCSNSFTGDYCNRCGQKKVHRITMSHIGHELAHAFTHADKGFLHLFIEMFKRPGIVAREYILEGKRKRYFTPFQYILVIGTLATFVAVNTHFIENAAFAMKGKEVYTAAQTRMLGKIAAMQGKYFNLLILFQLPFFALSAYLMYRKFKLNYAEHLTLQTFITAQTTILGMVVMLAVKLLGKPGVYVGFTMPLVSLVFQIFAYTQFFKERDAKGVLRAIGTNLLSLVFFIGAIILVAVIVSIYFMVFDKGVLKGG